MGDIVNEALRESGRVGVGQTPLAEDFNRGWSRLQWMLQQWARKRWLVYHLETKLVTCTGARSYTVGPGGQIDTGASSSRPDKIESAFLRQLVTSSPNQIDYPLGLLQSMEDFNRIGLKGLVSFPGWVFYDPSFPLGTLFPWPVPQANIYAVGVTLKAQLPVRFLTQAAVFNIPYEYYAAMMYNLALRLRPGYGIGTFPGDMLPGLAKDSLNVLRGANTAIARLVAPAELDRDGVYNIFSDQRY
jgi:hypothetical protein